MEQYIQYIIELAQKGGREIILERAQSLLRIHKRKSLDGDSQTEVTIPKRRATTVSQFQFKSIEKPTEEIDESEDSDSDDESSTPMPRNHNINTGDWNSELAQFREGKSTLNVVKPSGQWHNQQSLRVRNANDKFATSECLGLWRSIDRHLTIDSDEVRDSDIIVGGAKLNWTTRKSNRHVNALIDIAEELFNHYGSSVLSDKSRNPNYNELTRQRLLVKVVAHCKLWIPLDSEKVNEDIPFDAAKFVNTRFLKEIKPKKKKKNKATYYEELSLGETMTLIAGYFDRKRGSERQAQKTSTLREEALANEQRDDADV